MALGILLLSSLIIKIAYGTQGIATVYGTGDGGNCGWGVVPQSIFPYGNIVAIGADLWNQGISCGQCFEVECITGSNTNNCPIKTCKNTKVIVQAVDQCPECDNTHLDLSTKAFEAITASSGCIIDINFSPVPCPSEIGNIIVEGKGGSSKWHLEVFAKRPAEAVVGMAVRDDRNVWYECQHTTGQGFWLCNGGKPYSGNVDVRLTSSKGETLSTNNIFRNDNFVGDRDFGKNFASAPTTPTAPAPTAGTQPTSVQPTSVQPTSASGNIIVKMGAPDNPQYYLVFFIEGLACGGIASVEYKDLGNYPNYYGSTANYGTTEYQFGNNNGSPFQKTGQLKITNTNGQIIETGYIINDWTAGKTYDIGTNFCGAGVTSSPTEKPTTGKPTASKQPTTAIPTTVGSDGETCVPAPNLVWESKNHKIYVNGVEFRMKGLSWFGFDSDTFIVHGLASWAGGNSYSKILDWIADNNFNAIRLPFSAEAILTNPTIASSQYNGAGNSIFNGKKVLQAMDIIIDAAATRGILMMLDLHSRWKNQYTNGFDDLGDYTQTAGKVWRILARRYANRWNIFMADLYNEPHDITNARWGEWIDYCQYVGNLLIDEGVNWLSVVQGTGHACGSVGGDCPSTSGCNWGENLMALGCGPRKQQVRLKVDNKVVYSPHVYGPAIGGNSYGENYWKTRWGFITDSNDITGAIVLGEYGSRLNDNSERDWLDKLIAYLKKIDQRSTFFWCLNSNSGDTGGLIVDWNLNLPETTKLEKLADLQPNPTKMAYNSVTGNVCISGQQVVTTADPTAAQYIPPSKRPTTVQPTQRPTQPLTACPTNSRDRRRLSVNFMELENKNPQLWWLQFLVRNINCGSLSNAYIKDSGSHTTWLEYTTKYGCCEFAFRPSNGRYTYPISVKLVNSNGQSITLNNIFKNIVDTQYDTDTNFCYVDAVTPEPTSTPGTPQPIPTPAPTTASNNNNNGLVITTGNTGNPLWFFSLFVSNVACGSVTKVEFKDNDNYSTWYAQTAKFNNNEFQFNNNGQSFSTPGSLRITNSNGDVLTTGIIFTDLSPGMEYRTGIQFCDNGQTQTSSPTVSTTTTGAPTRKPSIRPTTPPTDTSYTPEPTNHPTLEPTRAGTYSIMFQVSLVISTSSSLPSDTVLEGYANDVTRTILILDDSYQIFSDLTSSSSTSLTFSITVYVDVQACRQAIDDYINVGTTFETDFSTQYQSKLNSGNTNVIIQQNAGVEIIYDQGTSTGNDAFWKKVTNILLIIIFSLMGLLCIICISFCVFCRVHAKKMRQNIRSSISRRMSKPSTQRPNASKPTKVRSVDSDVIAINDETNSPSGHAIIATNDE